jgi:hypothetical protein
MLEAPMVGDRLRQSFGLAIRCAMAAVVGSCLSGSAEPSLVPSRDSQAAQNPLVEIPASANARPCPNLGPPKNIRELLKRLKQTINDDLLNRSCFYYSSHLSNFLGSTHSGSIARSQFVSSSILYGFATPVDSGHGPFVGGIEISSYPRGRPRDGRVVEADLLVGLQSLSQIDCKTLFHIFGRPRQPAIACKPLVKTVSVLSPPNPAAPRPAPPKPVTPDLSAPSPPSGRDSPAPAVDTNRLVVRPMPTIGGIMPHVATRQEIEQRTIRYDFRSHANSYHLQITTTARGTVGGIVLERDEL